MASSTLDGHDQDDPDILDQRRLSTYWTRQPPVLVSLTTTIPLGMPYPVPVGTTSMQDADRQYHQMTQHMQAMRINSPHSGRAAIPYPHMGVARSGPYHLHNLASVEGAHHASFHTRTDPYHSPAAEYRSPPTPRRRPNPPPSSPARVQVQVKTKGTMARSPQSPRRGFIDPSSLPIDLRSPCRGHIFQRRQEPAGESMTSTLTSVAVDRQAQYKAETDTPKSCATIKGRSEPPPMEKPLLFVCSFPKCDKTFKIRSALVSHEKVHTTERPFVCLVRHCTATFKRRSDIKRHMKKVHKINNFTADSPPQWTEASVLAASMSRDGYSGVDSPSETESQASHSPTTNTCHSPTYLEVAETLLGLKKH